MKALFIGGTGTISAAISRLLLASGWDLTLLNRGNRNASVQAATGGGGELREIHCDINDEAAVAAALGDRHYDVVANFIAFNVSHVERDFRLFAGRCEQYLTLSSASAYQKPPADYLIDETTPLANPYWQYSRDKIAVENYLLDRYRSGFNVTVVRPSHTYDERSVPLGMHGKNGSWQILRRILDGKKVIIHGDGTSLWTLTHNSDFARAFAGLLGNVHALGQAVQITGDETLTWNQIYGIVAAALGKPLNAVHIASDFLVAAGRHYDFEGNLLGDKAQSAVFDNRKIKRLVPGWTATVRADQGLRATVAHILEHPECQRPDPEFDDWCDRVIAAQEQALLSIKPI
ncbi:hypothetical protein FACS1894139_03770 [Planctomycetales bacterium]|nr:hypothetical protein FACS1894107_16380 [Planctomycetales bacterium]GHS97679.1 hypothetical protein FACS1894108_04460 [Planctomycetales bacterium]GHT03455.1 hypothetical protein FACS1894139_03770 [Planctomycetales bacterium]